ncbi:MAG: hypothetical protein G8D28_10905 [gamma proteobacterium symbiont of Phacoides pectinatus]
MPLIRPFLDPGGSATGTHYLLIVRTSPENLRELRRMIERLDIAQRQLLIHVRQGGTAASDGGDYGAGARIRLGEGVRIEAGAAPDGTGARIIRREIRTGGRHDTTHRIKTLEGHAAFIETGGAIPLAEHTTTLRGGVAREQTTTRFHNATSGFYVTPRLRGEEVTLELRPFLNRPGVAPGTFELQSAATVILTRLGEWVEVGGSSTREDSHAGEILRRRHHSGARERGIRLMVEEITR